MSLYVRKNYGDNCFFNDSSFKRYNRYHNSRDINIFNIGGNTGHCCCGGGVSGWGAFGLGLGQALGGMLMGGIGMLGGMFGNMLGGMFNMFGGFGLGFGNFGLGFGNFGFGNMGLGSLWGAKQTDDDSSSDKVDDTKYKKAKTVGDDDKVDKNQQAYNTLNGKITTLAAKEEITQAEINALRKEINDSTDLDDANKQKLLAELDKIQPKSKAPVATGKYNGTDITALTAEQIGGITQEQFNKLAQADKDAIVAKVKTLGQADREALAQNTNIPAELRKAAKESLYTTGYTNYDGNTEIAEADLIKAHDKSPKTRDTVKAEGKADATITKAEGGKHPQTIVIHDLKDITYTYKEIKDGEYIYVSDQDEQEYALQKTAAGKYELVQYKWHKGYGKIDWSPNA